MPLRQKRAQIYENSDTPQFIRLRRTFANSSGMRAHELQIRIVRCFVGGGRCPSQFGVYLRVESNSEAAFLHPCHAAINPAYIAQADLQPVAGYNWNDTFSQHAARRQIPHLDPIF